MAAKRTQANQNNTPEHQLNSLLRQGKAHAKSGRFAEAARCLEDALPIILEGNEKLKKRHDGFWLSLAELYVQLDDISRARELYIEYMLRALNKGRYVRFRDAARMSRSVGGLDLELDLVGILEEANSLGAIRQLPQDLLEHILDQAISTCDRVPDGGPHALVLELVELTGPRLLKTRRGETPLLPVDGGPPQAQDTDDASPTSTAPFSPLMPLPELTAEVDRERLHALWLDRKYGAIMYRGAAYGVRLSISYMLDMLETDSRISRVEIEGVDDFDIYEATESPFATEPTVVPAVHVQAKSRDQGQPPWSVSELRDVLNNFAETYCANPNAHFIFITDYNFGQDTSLTGVLDYPDLGAFVEEHAGVLREIEDAIEDEYTTHSAFNLSEFIASISFQVVDRDIEYRLIQRVAELLGCLPAVATRYYDAIFRAVHGSAETAKKEGVRKPFTRPELERFLEDIRATIDASTLEAPIRNGNLEMLLFDTPGTTRPAPDRDYYLGVYADLRHIMAGQDILRPELMQALAVNLERRNFCVLRAPSGSGKSTLMYRFAYEHRHAFRIYRVNTLRGESETVEQCVRFVRTLQPSAESPVMLLLDNLFRSEKEGWPQLIGRLLEEPNVHVVATTRVDEWNPSSMRGLNVEYLSLSLSPDTASRFHQMLKERGQLHPDYPDWHEAYEMSKTNSEALFMEYAYLLTQGKHIKEVLDEQVARIEEQEGTALTVRLRALRYICTAHSYGGRVPANLLPRLVGYTDEEVKSYLRQLIDEHLITEERRFYVGLHEVRSTFLRDRTHDLPPPELVETLATLASQLPLDEVVTIAERACKQHKYIEDTLFEAIARRLDTEGDLSTVSDILRRLRIASEWHYADTVKVHLDKYAIRPNEISVFAVELAENLYKPIGLVHNKIFSAEYRKAFATVPRRTPTEQFERRLAARFDKEALVRKVDGCDNVGAISYFLNWLHAVAPDAAEEVSLSIDIPHLADLCKAEPSFERVVMLLFNIWLSNAEAYQMLVAEFGGEAALTSMIMDTYPSVMRLERLIDKDESRNDVDRVLTEFWASEPVAGLDDGASVHDKTVYLAEVTRRAFPMVDRVAAKGFFGTGQQYKLGSYSPAHKDMPVENVAALESVEKVRIWMRAIVQHYSFTTWYAYLQEQDSIRAKYVESLNLVAGLVYSFGGSQSRLSNYKIRAQRLAAHHALAGTESDNLLWPPDSAGKDFLETLGIDSRRGSDEAIHDQLAQGRYYRRADKEEDVDSPFRQYTSMVDNFIRWLCEYVIAGNRRGLLSIESNIRDAKKYLLEYHEHRSNVALRSEEHVGLMLVELRFIELLEASAKYLFKSEYSRLWDGAVQMAAKGLLLAERLERGEVNAGDDSLSALDIALAGDLIDSLPKVEHFFAQNNLTGLTALDNNATSELIEYLRSLNALDCFVALAARHEAQMREQTLGDIERALAAEGLQVRFGPPIVQPVSTKSSELEEILPIIFHVPDLISFERDLPAIFRQVFDHAFEPLQRFALLLTDGKEIVYPVVWTFSYTQKERWLEIARKDPKLFIGFCQPSADLLEEYSAHLALPVAGEPDYIASLKHLFDTALGVSFELTRLREQLRFGRKSTHDVADAIANQLLGEDMLTQWRTQQSVLTSFVPEEDFEPYHRDVLDFLGELLEQLVSEVDMLNQLASRVDVESEFKTLADMYTQSVVDAADARSTFQRLEAAAEYWTSTMKTPYAEKNLIQKYDLVYQVVKSYFVFGFSRALAA